MATGRSRVGMGRVWALAALWLCIGGMAQAQRHFIVTFAPSVQQKPFTGRVLVMLGRPGGQEPRSGPDWFEPQPFFAVDVKNWKPNTDLIVGEKALGYPGSLKDVAEGEYSVQAVMDRALDTHEIGNAPGNAYSPNATVEIGDKKELARLRIEKIVTARPFPKSDRVKLVNIPSPLLSKFYGRPVRQQAAVYLPADYAQNPTKKYPVVYIIPGFGGTHYMAFNLGRFPIGPGNIDALQVVLNPDVATGHSVFADSANNGPRGKALTTELIPTIEKTYRAVGKPYARFLNGHSSGGWSSLWLQVAYPDFFGGTWSTSPDPVDFRDFQRINLYAPDTNMFVDKNGQPRPLARIGDEPKVFYKPFSDMEVVLGHGGQLMSFEAVFSPKGENGKPKELWNKKTGAVDSSVAKAWEKYDISLILARNWKTLGLKLKGKLHVITGGMDTFYLEGAVKLMKARLAKLGSDAVVEIVPGKDHGTLLSQELQQRIGTEMMQTYAKKGK